MSGANASPIGRSHQEVSGAREAQARQGAAGNNASPTRSASAIARSLKKGRSHQEMNRRQFFLVWCPTSCLTPIWGRCIPLLAKEGWSLTSDASECVCETCRLSDHPVCGSSVASRLLIDAAATPFCKEGNVPKLKHVCLSKFLNALEPRHLQCKH